MLTRIIYILVYILLIGLWFRTRQIWLLVILIFAVYFFPSRQKDPQLRKQQQSETLSMLNPVTLFQVVLQLIGQWYVKTFKHSLLSKGIRYENKIRYRLPFEGGWMAANGGSTQENSHSWEILTQRYAYDFVITDQQGSSFRNEGRQLTDYYCYEKKILAPADGVVVKLRNQVRDYPHPGDGSIDWKTMDFRGNHLIIKHADHEYSFIAHIKKDSFLVTEGSRVKQGQVLALCGNSGHSTEPHIHFHLQDSPNFWFAAGLPVMFSDFIIQPGHAGFSEAYGSVEKNMIVANS